MKLIVGTRGSRLALLQTEIVTKSLLKAYPNLKIEIQPIRTAGDANPEKPLLEIKAKGIFEKEIDRAVSQRRVDFAVHSMKDIPTIDPWGTSVVAVPVRGPPNDVLVSRSNRKIRKLPSRATIGTSSPRRAAQISRVRQDLRIRPLRGNVETRIEKVKTGTYDAAILAEAGVKRLKLGRHISEVLSLHEFTPAPGQGALAVVTAKNNSQVAEILRTINHAPSLHETLAERAIIKKIGGGCKIPIGAIGRAKREKLTLHANVLSPDGKEKIEATALGLLETSEEIGQEAAESLTEQGAEELIKRWRELDTTEEG